MMPKKTNQNVGERKRWCCHVAAEKNEETKAGSDSTPYMTLSTSFSFLQEPGVAEIQALDYDIDGHHNDLHLLGILYIHIGAKMTGERDGN